MVSPSKLLDMRMRGKVLEAVEILVRLGLVENAKVAGQLSATLKNRIDTHDYSREDAFEAKLQEVKNYKGIGKEPEPWK